MPKLRVRHAFVAVLLLVAMLFQGTWALAGTTGGVSGYIRDSGGAPVADAKVTVSSPSEVTSATTDAGGHFAFLSLAPDTYVLSVSKAGYQDVSMTGVTVFADNVQTVSVTMPKALKTIATVRSQAASSLVKAGVGGDIYSVDPSTMQKTSALGGGGSMDSAYSAIASVPGLVVGTGGTGWNQAVVVRGANPWSTGFEYDSIPVNRAFDNYTASTGSNLGLQELQVYTGGGPSSISSSGTSGFINQVIKTGTYPGFGTISGGIATGAFYHSLRAEAGGASPNRNFSYYVGLGGYNQDYRYIDQQNGASLMGPSGMYTNYGYLPENTPTGQGVFAPCSPLGFLDPNTPPQGCLAPYFGNFYGYSSISDRENVVNLHFGIPRANGQKDDVQLMWSGSAMKSYGYSYPTSGDLNQYMVAVTGLPYCGPNGQEVVAGSCAALAGAGFTDNYPHYMDSTVYNLPFGTNIQPNGNPLPTQQYFQPSSPQNRAFEAPLPASNIDLFNNDTGIVKLQLTHPFDSRSFGRIMGYTFFSDWTEDGEDSAFGYYSGLALNSPNYDLITHTAGGMLQYYNQITDKHLLKLTGNYTHATVSRFNNTGFLTAGYDPLFYGSCPSQGGIACGGTSPVGLISQDGSGMYHCWSAATGNEVPCYSGAYQSSARSIALNGALPAPTGNAAAAGAQWSTLWNGNANGTYNNVTPNFYSAALEDEWRPSDKLTLNLSVRFDRFSYTQPNANTGQNPFYAQQVDQYSCYNPTTGAVLSKPLAPGVYPPTAIVLTSGDCSLQPNGAGYFHPGTNGVPHFTLNYPLTYAMNYWEPRISGTYTMNPDTVIRFSAGRFAEPPISASVNYLYKGGSAVNLWGNFMNLGFFSPFHPIPGQTSSQYDFSLEQRIHNTPMSFKLTPFYGTTSNWEQQSFIGQGFVTQIPVGRARNYGLEAQFNYGDFNKEGLSGLLSLTLTKSQVQYQPLLSKNQMAMAQQAIANYNAMTKSGGGAACYTTAVQDANGFNAPDPTCSDPANDITNPYYNSAPQSLNGFALDGWYPQGLYAYQPGVNGNQTYYNSPVVANLVLNYRKAKLAITPSVQLQSGAPYGGPFDSTGLDPRTCGANQGTTGVGTAATAQNCDFTTVGTVGAAPEFGYLYTPNQTGSFATPGQYTEPNILIGNLQLSYDVSPKVTLQLTATDLFHTCFGGSKEPWTSVNKPSSTVCGYYPNGSWVNNFYNGSGPTDTASNYGATIMPWELQSYGAKANNTIGGFFPFSLYLQAQIKL